jgi:integrase
VTDGVGTNHGFRSTFRSWCAAHAIDREVAELAIAHTVGGVEGLYQRVTDEGAGAKVVPFKNGKQQ